MIEQVSKASGSGGGGGGGGGGVARVNAPGYHETALSLAYLGFTWFFTLKPVLLGQCSN